MAMLELGQDEKAWMPPVLTTIARDGKGMDGLLKTAQKHFTWLKESGVHREKDIERSREEVFHIIGQKIEEAVFDRVDGAVIDDLSQKIAEREMDPYTAADELIDKAKLTQ
jgi:LAO/AO transport system kinase